MIKLCGVQPNKTFSRLNVIMRASHTNTQGYLNLTVCHITILHYLFAHSIDVFSRNNQSLTTFFAREPTTATIGFTKPVMYGGFKMVRHRQKSKKVDLCTVIEIIHVENRSKSSHEIFQELIPILAKLIISSHRNNTKSINQYDKTCE